MGVQGDLKTLELADLLQNIELHGKSGFLVVDSAEDSAQLYFEEGKLTLIAAPDRPGLMEVLVGAGRIDAEGLERARKKRKRSRKSLGEVLIELGEVSSEDLEALASARLLCDACELIVSRHGEFQFTPGGVPRGVFDPEERRLKLTLQVGPLLLEAARREDHWHMIRSRIASDSAHYRIVRPPRLEGNEAMQAIGAALVERLDGMRSVHEVVAPFPHQRFEAFQLLAGLAEQGSIRLVGPDEMAAMARDLEHHDPDRAWDVLGRGLARDPQNPQLLAERARASEARGDTEQAVDALKMLAHLHREAENATEAGQALERAADLAPEDTAIAERRLELARDTGTRDEAVARGLQLVELYRAPGLHKKASEVLVGLLEIAPESWPVRRELARSLAAAGNHTEAIASLERHARGELAAERYAPAREGFVTLLELDPSRTDIEARVAEIDSGATARRREHRRRLVARATLVGVALLLAVFTLLEVAARRAFAEVDHVLFEDRFLQHDRIPEAIELLEGLRADHPWSTVAWFDVPRRMKSLEWPASRRR